MTHDEIVSTAVSATPKVGSPSYTSSTGYIPELDFDYYLEALRRLKAALPDVHLKAFTAVEIWWFARITGLSYEEVLRQCVEGGPRLAAGRWRRDIRPARAPGASAATNPPPRIGWKSTALLTGMGIRTNSTMLYGHIETPEERIDHVLRLRDLQDETGGFQVFIPLRFHNEHNLMSHLPMATPYESLKVFTVSRLLLDNFDHMKALLDHAGAAVGADVAPLRRRRPRRYRRGGTHLPHGRRRDAARSLPGRPAAAHPRGGPHPGAARYGLQHRAYLR